jgi:hypothetical protein
MPPLQISIDAECELAVRCLPDQPTSWLKIRNRSYSQRVGREELFERERSGNPVFRGSAANGEFGSPCRSEEFAALKVPLLS